MKTLRCAIYTRKSSEEGLEQNFNSLHAQRGACEAYVQSQAGEGWIALPALYDDGGFSGGSMERPALKQLMSDLERGIIDIVVVYKVDRLTRSLADFSKIVERFDAKGVSFVSVTQAFNTTNSMGRLTLNVLLSFAQFEREVTGERIRDKIAASKAKGMWMGGRPPLGYDGVDQKLQINEAEAKLVCGICSRYLQLGSVVKLTRELADQGVRSKSWVTKKGEAIGGATFSRGAVYYLLSNPVYRGAIRHKKLLHWGSHPPIIDEATWDAVQAKLAVNGPGSPRSLKAGAGAFLKGVLFDDVDNAMQPIHANRRGRRYHYYVSSPRVHGDAREVGSLPRIAALTLDTLVRDRLGAVLRPGWLREAPVDERLRGALKRVTLSASLVTLEVLAEACRDQVRTGAVGDEGMVKIHVTIRLKHRQSATLIAADSGPVGLGAAPDRALVRAVCITREWRRLLESGEVASTRDLARREGLCHRHTGRILPLAYLAPDLVEAILEGRQPRAMTLQALTEKPLPRGWSEQRELVGSFA